MDLSSAFARIVLRAVAGGVVGLLVGLLLVAVTDRVDNPFWSMSLGIAFGAASAPVLGRDRGPHT